MNIYYNKKYAYTKNMYCIYVKCIDSEFVTMIFFFPNRVFLLNYILVVYVCNMHVNVSLSIVYVYRKHLENTEKKIRLFYLLVY